MAYMHIDNLYKDTRILMFRKCYAMEKIHGTSAHVRWKGGELTFFSGGCKHENFVALFNHDALKAAFEQAFPDGTDVVVYGEAYGGKMQKMSEIYGKDLKFIAFEVKLEDEEHLVWLSVPAASKLVMSLGFEFVYWQETDTDIDTLDKLRDSPSVQAMRNGCGNDKPREGIVLRPPFEVTINNGKRLIAKHKGDAFKERCNQPKIGQKPMVLHEAEKIADEWVTHERIRHVCDALGLELRVENIGQLIKGMNDDIEREAEGEIISSASARKAIGKRTALMVKEIARIALRA